MINGSYTVIDGSYGYKCNTIKRVKDGFVIGWYGKQPDTYGLYDESISFFLKDETLVVKGLFGTLGIEETKIVKRNIRKIDYFDKIKEA